MKYVNTGVVFQEIPDEVTLSVNISNCPCRCEGCHSQYLWEDIGTPLNALTLGALLKEYGGDITCVCLMGGDAEPGEVNSLAELVGRRWPSLRVGWYSGRHELPPSVNPANFDYIKLGGYVQELGGLKSRTTNQRMYKVNRGNGEMTDITPKFWK